MSGALSAGAVAAARRRLGAAPEGAPLAWRLRVLPVCASTETELDRWLARQLAAGADPPRLPVAVLAERQRFGRGQQGRVWSSPPGGVWLSAALPWPQQPTAAAALGLAVAVGLAKELQSLLTGRGDASVALKWPNDLLLCRPGQPPRKLAGLLPRLRQRGLRVRWARVGVGLNGCNRVPPAAAALVDGSGSRCAPGLLGPVPLAARVLRALEWAVARAGQPDRVRQEAEALLWPGPPLDIEGQLWQPCGLAADGRLRLVCGPQERWLERRF